MTSYHESFISKNFNLNVSTKSLFSNISPTLEQVVTVSYSCDYIEASSAQLDYGSPIYSQTCKSALSLLKIIQTSSLRLSLVAFRTSPHLSLCAEAAEPSLTYRTLILASNFLASTAQFPELPIYNSAPKQTRKRVTRSQSRTMYKKNSVL